MARPRATPDLPGSPATIDHAGNLNLIQSANSALCRSRTLIVAPAGIGEDHRVLFSLVYVLAGRWLALIVVRGRGEGVEGRGTGPAPP